MSLEEIVDSIETSPASSLTATRVVAVDGFAGAGKSTFAIGLAIALDAAPIIPTDDFASWEDPFGWDSRFMDQVLFPLSRGEAIRYQRFDWETSQLSDWVDVSPRRYLLIEGVGASRLEFAPYLTFAVWIDCDRDERLRRGLERDGAEMLGRWLAWMAVEEEYLERQDPKTRANLVIRGDS